MRLSFIIPCYNSAKTIVRCLDSIYALHISESDFEVIIVNDASTDETCSLVEEYAQGHSQLIQINHLVNRCVGAARNSGLAIAKGKVIAFVDSDDEVAQGMVRALELMESRDLDMVALCLEMREEDGTVSSTIHLPYSSDIILSGIRFQEDHPFKGASAWAYLYSNPLIEKVRYPFVEGVYYEDVDFVCHHLLHAKRISYCDECAYLFYVNPDSITHTLSPKHAFSYTFLGVRLLSLYELLDDKNSIFANSILEGGSYNIMKAFRYLINLKSRSDRRLFYNLLDTKVDRKSLQSYKEPLYCWTVWTKLGLRHRYLTTMIAGFVSLLVKLKPVTQ